MFMLCLFLGSSIEREGRIGSEDERGARGPATGGGSHTDRVPGGPETEPAEYLCYVYV